MIQLGSNGRWSLLKYTPQSLLRDFRILFRLKWLYMVEISVLPPNLLTTVLIPNLKRI